MAARNEMRFDDSFSDSERCFGSISVSEIWMFVNLWTSKTPTGEVLFFCEQMTHHFDVICIYPAMYDDNQNIAPVETW